MGRCPPATPPSRWQLASRAGKTTGETESLHEVLQALSYDLAGMGSLVAYLRPASASVFQHQATADLLQAQAWRAAWLAGAAALVATPYRPGRTRPVGAIVERVRAGLEAEARLTRLHLEVSMSPELAAMTFDENLGSVGPSWAAGQRDAGNSAQAAAG